MTHALEELDIGVDRGRLHIERSPRWVRKNGRSVKACIQWEKWERAEVRDRSVTSTRPLVLAILGRVRFR
jgi:hypothetical protein